MADLSELASVAPVAGSAFGPVGTVVGLGVSALPELFKTINGISQLDQAKKINPTRPIMQVPQSVDEAVNTARAQYYNPRLPNEDYIAGRIGSSAAGAVRKAEEAGRTPAEILAAAAGAEDNQNDALMNLAMEGARNRNMNANALYGQLDNKGVWEDKASAYNQRQPYAEQVAAKSALTDAGNQNIYGGLEGLSKVAATATGGGNTKSGSAPNPFFSGTTPKASTASTNTGGWDDLNLPTLYKMINNSQENPTG